MEDPADILADSHSLFDEIRDTCHDLGYIPYGKDFIKLNVPPKEGKANTLLADQLFSPALLLSELIHTNTIKLFQNPYITSILELGAGTALPSLLASTITPFEVDGQCPCQQRLITITDYPDGTIMNTLATNIENNQHLTAQGVRVMYRGYEWGTDAQELIELVRSNCTLADGTSPSGYDLIFLSDLLYYRNSHFDILKSCSLLLARNERSRIYAVAGKYTSEEVCNHFFQAALSYGITFSDIQPNDGFWHGEISVGGWSYNDLCLRKSNVQWWVGRWIPCVAG